MLKAMTLAVLLALSGIAPAAAQQSYGTSLSLEHAKKILAAAEAEAIKNNWQSVIAIVDATGHLQLLSRMDNAPYGSIKIAIGKAEAAFNFRMSTKLLQDRVNSGTAMHLLSSGATLIEGGLPLVVNGKVVGAIGVSGGTTSQDAQVAKAGLDALQ
jgi:glc operon protein GlcG